MPVAPRPFVRWLFLSGAIFLTGAMVMGGPRGSGGGTGWARLATAGDRPPAPIGPVGARGADLPSGIVARVRGRDVSAAEFESRLVERVRSELADPSSSAMGVLKILIEETVVFQETERLGIRVTTEDYDREYVRIDALVRARFGGDKSLADVIKEQGMPAPEFRKRVEIELRKERIAEKKLPSLPKDPSQRLAQIEVVIKQILKESSVEFANMPVGVVAKVNGAPITVATFGAVLRVRLAESEIRRHLQELCITMLIDQEGLAFTEADVDREFEFDRPMWERMKAEALTSEKRELPFEGFLQLRYNTSIEELHKSLYRRGIFALRRRLRESVSDDDVLKAWTAGSQEEYGSSFVVTDIMVSFQIPNAVAEPVKRRTLEEAKRLMADFARRLTAGEPLKAIEAEIKSRGDRSMLVERRSVINKGNDILAYEAASKLTDGGWSAPIEGMSEMHLVRRESYRPAPKLDDVRLVVKQHLVDQRGQFWLQERLLNDIVIAK